MVAMATSKTMDSQFIKISAEDEGAASESFSLLISKSSFQNLKKRYGGVAPPSCMSKG